MAENITPNEAYVVTARKWRPRIFSEVTSQDFVTRTLKNAIKQNRISHAYLFSGPRGVGKTTVARILAKSLNCKNPTKEDDPCNECESCKEIDNDNRNHPDVFEIDGASNRNIEDIRELKEKVKYGPIRSKFKIFIIDEVHMLTGASFNALLKTLEEPPSYVVFVFATTAPEKVPLTILGRCQKFEFKRLTIEEIIARLKEIAEKEKIKIDEESLFFISKKGDGSMRDAQGLFDMSTAYCDNDIKFEKLQLFFNLAESDVYFSITDYIIQNNYEGLLNYFAELMNRGYDMQTFLDGLTEHYRNLLIAVSTGSPDLILESENIRKKYQENIPKFSQIEIINSLKLILQSEYTFKYSSNQRTLIEALLVELIKFTDTKDISQILDELKKLKSGENISLAQSNTGHNKTADTGSKPVRYEVNKPEPTISSSGTITAQVTPSESANSSISSPIGLPTSYNDMQTHWTSIIDQIKTERKWVYSMIKDSSFEVYEDKSCNINVHENRYEFLSSYQDYLTAKISNYFGEPLKLNFVKQNDPEHAEIPSPVRNINIPKENNDNFEKIRSAIMTEFEARDVTNEEKP